MRFGAITTKKRTNLRSNKFVASGTVRNRVTETRPNIRQNGWVLARIPMDYGLLRTYVLHVLWVANFRKPTWCIKFSMGYERYAFNYQEGFDYSLTPT